MLALALLLCASDPTVAAPLDEGPIVDAVEAVLAGADDVVRIALPPIDDTDAVRRPVLERALVRAIRDRNKEEVVTPALLRAQLRSQADAQERAIAIDELKPYAADHVLLCSVVVEGERSALRLRLVKSETGEVRGESSASLGASDAASSASAASVRFATDDLVEQIAYALESRGVVLGAHRVGVPPLSAAPGAATESRLDVFVQSELVRALGRRGLLVVERARIDAAIDQAALGQELGEQGAPQVGKLAGADSIVIGQVADAGDVFVVNARVVDVTSGQVIGAASARLPREDVVVRADVETRTPSEAAFRSAVAPGWGQAYNGEPVKSVAFAVGTYGGALSTLGLAIGGAVAWRSYQDLKPGEGLTADEVTLQAPARRQLANTLLLSSSVAAGITLVLWGAGIVDAWVSSPSEGDGA
jgi:TolB-like protein